MLVALASMKNTQVQGKERTLCYSGSDMYQKLTVDCTAQDSEYTGTWYCATISVCEQYISSSRNCMTTRGCAKADQCDDGGNIYSGTALSNYPAGMTIKPKCCLNSELFASDDGALDYNIICNSSSKQLQVIGVSSMIVILAIVSMATHIWAA